MSVDHARSLRAVGARIAGFGAALHPMGGNANAGEKFAKDVLFGVPPYLALSHSGAAPAVVRFMERTDPRDLLPVLETLASALARHQARTRELRMAAVYPLVLAGVAIVLSAVVQVELLPVLERLAVDTEVRALRGATLFLSVLGIGAGSLVALGLSILSSRHWFPFTRVKLALDRSLLLRTAAAVSHQGVVLTAALRAGGELVTSAALRRDVEDVAIALGRGSKIGWTGRGIVLFGPLGAALFSAAAEKGAGPHSLEALADFSESDAASRLPSVLRFVEFASAALGAIAILAGAVPLFTYYALVIGG